MLGAGGADLDLGGVVAGVEEEVRVAESAGGPEQGYQGRTQAAV